MSKDWRNRIVEIGEEEPSNLLANPKNFRRHPKSQQTALRGVLDEVGWVQDVIVNKRTGHLIDGHLRVELAMRKNVSSVPVKYVDLSEEEEALVLSTFDPISAMATADKDVLADLLREVTTDNDSVKKMIDDLAEKHGIDLGQTSDDLKSRYTMTVESPVYKITGEEPPLESLASQDRYRQLLNDIDVADIPEDIKQFLRLAAGRHVVFDYRKIAEYYAHADEEVQRLMEDSALVIIDFNRAIELGYVKLRDDILDLIEEAVDG